MGDRKIAVLQDELRFVALGGGNATVSCVQRGPSPGVGAAARASNAESVWTTKFYGEGLCDTMASDSSAGSLCWQSAAF